MPKSSTDLTSPAPKNCCQSRFTVTRASNGFCGETSHRARPSRFSGAPGSGAPSTSGGRRETGRFLSGRSYCPRDRTNVGVGVAASCITMTFAFGPAGASGEAVSISGG